MGVVHLHLLGLLGPEQGSAGLDAVPEQVAHRHQPDAGIGGHGVARGAGAPAAAADDADPDQVAAGRMGRMCQGHSGTQGHTCGRGFLHEITSVDRTLVRGGSHQVLLSWEVGAAPQVPGDTKIGGSGKRQRVVGGRE